MVFASAFRNIFQSTHPVWGGTKLASMMAYDTVFQSTHPVWGGTDGLYPCFR